jgi:hypothetical protein
MVLNSNTTNILIHFTREYLKVLIKNALYNLFIDLFDEFVNNFTKDRLLYIYIINKECRMEIMI